MEIEGTRQTRVYDLCEWHRVVAKCWRCGLAVEITYRVLRPKRSGPTHLADAGYGLATLSVDGTGDQVRLFKEHAAVTE